MANPEHLAILKQRVAVWNQWREERLGVQPDLIGADLGEAYLAGTNLTVANLIRADLHGANLCEANLSEADLRGANLRGAMLITAYLYWVDLREANLSDAVLIDAVLSRANLSEAVLYGASLAGADLSGADLSGVDLREADLYEANLNDAVLSRANLSHANLYRANLSRANLSDAVLNDAALGEVNLSQADLSGANLSGADLSGANVVEADFEGANLTGCRIFGISAWKVNLAGATQTDLIISDTDEPEITVDNLEVAQFIYLLLNNERVRDIINTITTKVVLILGRFTPERKAVLDAIREELRQHNYVPVLFDFDKPASRNLTETIRTLAHLARFIIADITNPRSVPQELQAIVPGLAVPVQAIIEETQQPWGMFQDHPNTYHWVLAVHRYRDLNDLLSSLRDKVIGPAEAKAKELEKRTKQS